MPIGFPPYVIIARKPACGCLVMVSCYWPGQNNPELPQEIAGCIKRGLLIQTLPWDQNPLKTETLGCDHAEGQLTLTLD